MIKKMMNNRYIRFYFAYTILFLVMAFVIFRPFITNGISFVWNIDGWTQHYKALYFYSDWLKKIGRALIHDHRLSVDLYSFSLGYGSDIISTLHYYVVGDPICLLSAFVPKDKLIYFYDLSFYLRFYLAGITFSLYCFYMKQKNDAGIMAGTLLYCFPILIAKVQLHHPFFTNPFVYLPLLLIGVEMIIRKSSKMPFILAVFLSAVSNFYFFYMLVVLTVIYVFVRLGGLWKENQLQGTARLLVTYLVCGLLGTLLSSAVLFPVLYLFRNGARMQISSNLQNELFYSNYHYKTFFFSLFTIESALCMTCVSFFCLVLLFMKGGNRQLKAGTIILFAIFLLPMGGRMMNGFSYSSNRWSFGLICLLAYIVVVMWDDLLGCSLREAAVVLGIFGLCFASMVYMYYSTNRWDLLAMLRYVFILAVCAGLVMILPKFIHQKRIHAISSLACLIIVCIAVVLRLHFCFDPNWRNVVKEYTSKTKVQKYILPGLDKAVMETDDGKDSFFRYGAPHAETRRNSTVISGLKGINYYWSLADGVENQYFMEMGLPTKNDFNYRNVNDVTSLTDLASVKYYVIESKRGRRRMVPFGFENRNKVKEVRPEGTTLFSVYKNQYFLPLGYTYESVINDEQYNAMSYIERQNAVLQGIHIPDEEKVSDYAGTEPTQDYKELHYHIIASDGVKVEGNIYKTLKKDGIVTFELEDALPEAATSLMIKGIRFTPIPETMEAYRTLLAVIKLIYNEEDEDNISSIVQLGTDNYIRYSDRHDFLVNMGYSDVPKKTFSIEFPQEGTYKIEQLAVYNQPMDTYPRMLNKLREDVLEDTNIDGNTITGAINLDKDKILCLTIPYSTGWKARVNGKDTRIVRGNTMFMAIPLKKGHNEIRLSYCTPLLPQGLFCSAAGILLCIIIIILEKRKRVEAR